MAEMKEVLIDSVRVSLTNQQRIVMLREVDTERYLPIWIGPFEAEAITISLQEIEVARPQTHDLLIKSMEALGARLIRVEIVSLKGDVFYGNLVLEQSGQTIEVDARPSDSIALAVRAHVPILVDSDILGESSIEPDKDLQPAMFGEDIEASPPESSESEGEETKKRLSVFENFLKDINLDELDKGEDNPDSPDKPEDPGTPPPDDDDLKN